MMMLSTRRQTHRSLARDAIVSLRRIGGGGAIGSGNGAEPTAENREQKINGIIFQFHELSIRNRKHN